MRNISERVIEALKSTGRIREADIRKALVQYAKEDKGHLRDILVKMGLVSEKELASLLSEELKIPFLNLAKYKIDPLLAQQVPEKLARKHHLAPVSKIGGTLTVAMADPLNVLAIEDLAIMTQNKVDCVLSTEKDIAAALDRLYAKESEDIQTVAQSLESSGDLKVIKEDEGEVSRLDASSSDAPVVRMVDLVLMEALKRRASDIHIEPFEHEVRVRYRVDGALEEALKIPKKIQNAVLTRLKILSRLDITENRIPQDGRFKVKLTGKEVDFRVSILPVHFGNKMVMRILDQSSIHVGLNRLGFSEASLEDFDASIRRPFGMILITGPTGSGKSTTLYSILDKLNTPDKNLITIEDPIEYQVKGITQIQTKTEIGLDFASGLRAILRQSPDIVMVGEIRDSETADIAIKASLTGQLVLSTLHTNDSAGAMTRLIDMGVEPFLISSSLVLVAAQRLCRKVCLSCRQKIEIPKEVLERQNIVLDAIAPDSKNRIFYKGKGCEKCSRTGYLGRMGICETLRVDDSIREMVVRRVSSHEIKEYAVGRGMVPLREDAIKKMCQGLTTLDEVLRVTSGDV